MIFGLTEREVGKKGEKKGKGVEGKFSLRTVCQNHIPFSLVITIFFLFKDPSIKNDLESLANSGHLPAVIMLGKLAPLETDAEALVR